MIENYLKDLVFCPEIADRFEEHVRAIWLEKIKGVNNHLAQSNREIADLRDQADALFEKIEIARSPAIVHRLEAKYEILQKEIENRESRRQKKEYEEDEIDRVIGWGRYLFEHLDELIAQGDDEALRQVVWDIVFLKRPNVKEIQFRTAQISPAIRLKEAFVNAEGSMVSHKGSNLNQLLEELSRWAELLLPFVNSWTGSVAIQLSRANIFTQRPFELRDLTGFFRSLL